ncbi:MAG: TolC family protein [Thermus sp.]|uniref:TolC family protein n=1 Tax=Thermus sp. TaxID=275 RepID=UPI003D128549
MRKALLPFLLAPALAQGALAPLQDHPLARQGAAYLEAARKALEAQESPLALQVQGSYARLGYECAPEALCGSLPATTGSLTLSLSLTPFPFGEVADGRERARIALRRAELGYRRTLSALQAQAVAAWGRYQQALLGERVARKALELSQKALEAARKRQASPKELREAELNLKEAENRLEEARRGVDLARRAAEGLVDLGKPLPEIPPPKGGAYLAVEEAKLAVLEAEISYQSALRNLLPQAQASYLLYPSGNDTLALSLGSRTLQPTLSYTRADPARPPTQVPGGSYRAKEELRLTLSLTLSPGLLSGLEAAQAQLKGAEAALKAAEEQARLQEASLKSALQSAEAALALARLRREAQAKALEETRKRLELGLESPLALLQAELGLLQAELALLQAQSDLLSKRMELYQLYGELLEVNP